MGALDDEDLPLTETLPYNPRSFPRDNDGLIDDQSSSIRK